MRRILLFLVLGTLMSCEKWEKDPLAYYPTVRTISATVMADGKVMMQGEIISEGYSDVTIAGFCCSTSPVPEMKDNQVISWNTQGLFYAQFDASLFVPGTRYYFRSFATNEQGYSYGNVVELANVSPCNAPANTIQTAGVTEPYLNIDTIRQTYSWRFIGQSAGQEAEFVFDARPTTGIYWTTDLSFIESDEVMVIFDNPGFSNFRLEPGWRVYVTQLGQSEWEVFICSAPWHYSSGSYTMTTHFVFPL